MNCKMALVALVSTLSVASLAAPQMGTMTDPRDGKAYKTGGFLSLTQSVSLFNLHTNIL